LPPNVPLILMCHPSVPAKNLKEFVNLRKEQNKPTRACSTAPPGRAA
jgi:hypothetical protein